MSELDWPCWAEGLAEQANEKELSSGEAEMNVCNGAGWRSDER